MTRVMHLMSTHAFSGAENVACQIISCFKDDKNYEMIYVSQIKENKKNLVERNIKYYKLKKFNYINVLKAIKEYNPDIIHAHDIRASIMASLFHKKAIIISHIHANHENMRKIGMKTIIFNLISKNIKHIIWVSKSALENYKFKKNIINKSSVLYNAINSEEIIEKIKKDNKEYPMYDLIYLGRLSYQKNPLRLIYIINEIYKKNKNIKVAIVGSGKLENEVIKCIKNYGLENNIDLYGFVSNPYKILSSSRCLIITSRYEGTPMCALEALALGKPIITTPTDGLIDIVKNNINGIISNDDNELVENIINIINSKEKLRIMSNNIDKDNRIINNIRDYKEKIKEIYINT